MSSLENAVSAHSFIIERADLITPQIPDKRFDLKNIILDIDIFEHINKPYLTGTVTVIDDTSLYSGINFKGIEYLALTLRLPDPGFKPITKVFYIDRVVTNQRANDQEAVLMFHISEDIKFIDEFINVNESFEGKGSEIIKQLMKRYFEKNVETDRVVSETQPPFKIVVPNISPLSAADWVKDRITSQLGAPYYLFSTLAKPDLFLRNFETMIFNPVNTKVPFRYSQALVNKNQLSLDDEMFIIENHHDNETADISRLNDSGFVNAKFVFHDVVRNRMFVPGNTETTRYREGYNNSQVGKRWTAQGLFDTKFFEGRTGTSQKLNSPYPSEARLPWKLDTDPNNSNPLENPRVHERPESRIITQLYASRQYGEQFYGYNEGRTETDHLMKVDSKAIRNWAVSSPLTFTVPGRLFLSGAVHATIGYMYRLEFTSFINEQLFRDAKRSGDYLIFTARHSFSKDHGYRVHMTGISITAQNTRPSDKIETPIRGPQ